MVNLNPDDKCINIPFSKTKLAVQLILAIIFGAGGLYFVANANAIANSGSHHRFVFEIVTVGVICLVFSICGIIAFGYPLFSSKDGLQIDQNGITIQSVFSKTYVTWGEISRFEVKGASRTRLVNIYLTDPYGYSQRQKGALQRRLLLFSYKKNGPALNISAINLKCSFDELYALLNNRLDAYNGLQKPLV
jgi:hypothetical protein